MRLQRPEPFVLWRRLSEDVQKEKYETNKNISSVSLFFVCFVFLFISTTRGAIHASQIERLERTRIEPAVDRSLDFGRPGLVVKLT
jgi:hypothetical protein